MTATEIDDDEYHVRADDYMLAVHEKAEEIQEDREDVEVEYSVRKQRRRPSSSPKLTPNIGRRPISINSTRWHLHHQQATTEQADLALVPDIWAKAFRLGA